jgi:hypothetical protein
VKIEIADFPLDLRDAAGKRMGEGRSAGMHVGEVVAYICDVGLGLKFKASDDGTTQAYQLQGFLFEKLMTQTLIDYAKEGWYSALEVLWQKELEWEKLFGTPDGIVVDDPRRIISIKWTTKGMVKTLESFETQALRWVMMDQAYLYMASQFFGVPFTTAEYLVSFAAEKPQRWPRKVMVEFTGDELVQNWRTIQRAAESLRRRKEGTK